MEPPAVLEQPVAHLNRNRYLTVQPSQAANCKYLRELLELWCTQAPQVLEALPVLDKESGKHSENKQLQQHPTLKDMWDTSYSNELCRLCQGIGKETVPPKKHRNKGTGTFKVIRFNDITFDKRKNI